INAPCRCAARNMALEEPGPPPVSHCSNPEIGPGSSRAMFRAAHRHGTFMEPSGRNRWQPVANGTRSKPLKQADSQLSATHGNRFGAHGNGERRSSVLRTVLQVDGSTRGG